MMGNDGESGFGRTFGAALLLVSFFVVDAGAVTIAWSPVGNPGNAPDTVTGSPLGAVDYDYNIGTYDVTNSQYAELLNAKDPTGANTLGLYNSGMGSSPYGGISYIAGNPDGNKYSVIAGDNNHPVNFVTWYDTIRFANWMNNGQGNGDTESGAYTLLGGTPTPSNANSIVRNAGATIFLPSENEWYKAAYYNAPTHSYFIVPTSNGLGPHASAPPGPTSSANYENVVGNLTNVGAYTGTTSPYGAFDMGGNIWQWNEAFASAPYVGREARGSAFDNDLNHLTPYYGVGFDPSGVFADVGFRLASVPEPSSVILAALGAFALLAYRNRQIKVSQRALADA
jgi:formylglycine-generating enzyme